MPRPTGQQWVRLYRGLAQTTPEQINRKEIGNHWSVSPDVAYNFATNRDAEGWAHDEYFDDMEDYSPSGTIVEALVHRRHIIDPNSEEGDDWASMHSVFGPEHSEQERTVRPDATIHIQKLHYVDEGKNEERTINVPRNLRSRGRA